MFIRKAKARKSGKIYESFRLVECVRVKGKPRQQLILNLGPDFHVPVERHTELCGIIEGKLNLTDDHQLIGDEDNDLEWVADSIVKKIIAKNSKSKRVEGFGKLQKLPTKIDYVPVDLDSLAINEVRSLGGEIACLTMINRLEIPQKLKNLGFSRKKRGLAIGFLVAQILNRENDRGDLAWLQENSAIGELIDLDFNPVTSSEFNEISALLLSHKEALEKGLYQSTCENYSLQKSTLFYDLTNIIKISNSQRKQKYHDKRFKKNRPDTKCLTVGMALNGQGFPGKCVALPENSCDLQILQNAMQNLKESDAIASDGIVLLDAETASLENLTGLRSAGYTYITISSKTIPMPEDIFFTSFVKGNKIVMYKVDAVQDEPDFELIIGSKTKVTNIEKMKFIQRHQFEQDLEELRDGLNKKWFTKELQKVRKRIGSIRKKHTFVSKRYNIKVIPDRYKKKATNIEWNLNPKKEENRIEEAYRLRTNRDMFDKETILGIFKYLTFVKNTQRSLKPYADKWLISRANDIQPDLLAFITVMTYHVVHGIRHELQKSNLPHSWEAIQATLAGHYRVYTTLKSSDNCAIHMRQNSRPTSKQNEIYRALKAREVTTQLIRTDFKKIDNL